MRIRITIVVASAIAVAMSFSALTVQIYRDGFTDLLPIPLPFLFSPTLMLAVCCYLLLRGSRIARIVLGAMFSVIVFSFVFFLGKAVLFMGLAIETFKYQIAFAVCALFPTSLLLFSRGLGRELQEAREMASSVRPVFHSPKSENDH